MQIFMVIISLKFCLANFDIDDFECYSLSQYIVFRMFLINIHAKVGWIDTQIYNKKIHKLLLSTVQKNLVKIFWNAKELNETFSDTILFSLFVICKIEVS